MNQFPRLVVILSAAITACGPSRMPLPARPLELPGGPGVLSDATRLYHAMGRAAAHAPVSFVGAVAYFAGRNPDTTLTLVSISLPNRALTFVRESDRYRAPYGVQIRLLRRGAEVTRVDALEIVRVGAFRETGRTDESVIFQRWLRVAPGAYTVRLVVRDVGGGRSSADSLALVVPRLASGAVSTALPVYEARLRERLDSLPSVLARPRSTAVFGRDSLVSVYVEAYGPTTLARVPVRVTVRNEGRAVVWTDSTSLPRRGALFSGILTMPVANVGLGVGVATVTRVDAADTADTPLFVSFGDDLPVAPFEEMISYLRFFASASRLRTLRDAPPERRGALWAQFLRDTDPAPNTPEHEALQAYFARIQLANARYRDDAPIGWLSDRGMVFVSLGEPDQIYEQTAQQTGLRRTQGLARVLVWEYRQHHMRLVFTDQSETGRFRLTPSSEIEFRSVSQRLLGQ